MSKEKYVAYLMRLIAPVHFYTTPCSHLALPANDAIIIRQRARLPISLDGFTSKMTIGCNEILSCKYVALPILIGRLIIGLETIKITSKVY